MADVSRQCEDRLIDVDAFLVPSDQATTDKSVAKILNAWSGVVTAYPPAELVTQLSKRIVDNPTTELCAAYGKKERLRVKRRRNGPIAKVCVS
jgi:hypothetical protein